MPGFGRGAFGSFPFGHWKWSYRVLFELMPEIYRQQDVLQGGLLETFMDGLRPSFDRLRNKIRNFGNLQDPLKVRTQYDDVEIGRLGKVQMDKGTIEQMGVNASVNALQEFVAPTGRFDPTDVGSEIFISGSVFSQNNTHVTLTNVINSTTIVTDPFLVADSGPLQWELRSAVPPATDHISIEMRSGDAQEIKPGWLIYDGFSNFTILSRSQFGDPTDKLSLTQQEGTDGAIDSSGRFTSNTVLFSQLDVGKKLTLTGFVDTLNDGKYEIVQIVAVGGNLVAVLDASPQLPQAAGLTWAVLPFPILSVAGTVPPAGVIEQEGVDLVYVTSDSTTGTFTAASGSFTSLDVGNILTISGSTSSPSNDGTYEILSTPTASTVVLSSTTFVAETAPFLGWAIRTPAIVETDETQVQFSAPSLITSFAPNFGITIDTQESELRQRSWLQSVSQWTEMKGTAKAYQIIGAISGFNVTVEPVFHINAEFVPGLPDGSVFEVGDPNPGRSGTDGTLSQVGIDTFQFSSPTAAFTPSDVGLSINVTGAANSPNNTLYTIVSIISTTTVQFGPPTTVSLPDANNGALVWTIVRLYTDLPPLLPDYDDMNSDLLEEIINATSNGFLQFLVDTYCWESTFSTTVEVHTETVAVPPPSPGVQQIWIQGLNPYYTSPSVVQTASKWTYISLVAEAAATSGNNLSGTQPFMILSDVAANFSADLVGDWITFAGTTTPANSGTFQILEVIDATHLQFFNGFGVAEALVGTYQIFSEVDYALDTVPLEGVDPLGPMGVAQTISQSGTTSTMTDTAATFSGADVGLWVQITDSPVAGNNGLFQITANPTSHSIQYVNANGANDSSGSAMWQIGQLTYSFQTASVTAPPYPATSFLRYNCAIQSSCDYCAANRVLLTIEPTLELLSEGGTAVERLFDRLLDRMVEVTPAHVTLLIVQKTTLPASLTLTAKVIAP